MITEASGNTTFFQVIITTTTDHLFFSADLSVHILIILMVCSKDKSLENLCALPTI